MPSNVGALAGRKLRAVGKELSVANRAAANKAGLAFKRELEHERDRAAPGGRMRNVGRNGAKLGIRYRVEGTDEHMAVRFTATGPWPLIEGPTKAHTIRPRRRRGRRAAVSTPYGPRASVHVRGTRGKRPWAKGVTAGITVGVTILRRAYSDAVKRGMRS